MHAGLTTQRGAASILAGPIEAKGFFIRRVIILDETERSKHGGGLLRRLAGTHWKCAFTCLRYLFSTT